MQQHIGVPLGDHRYFMAECMAARKASVKESVTWRALLHLSPPRVTTLIQDDMDGFTEPGKMRVEEERALRFSNSVLVEYFDHSQDLLRRGPQGQPLAFMVPVIVQGLFHDGHSGPALQQSPDQVVVVYPRAVTDRFVQAADPQQSVPAE